MVIGTAVTALNDQGFHFKVNPPVMHVGAVGEKSSRDQEALVMCFDTAGSRVFMNVAMRYNQRRKDDRP
jgi:CheY-specific phosphatase CheX